MKFYPAQRHVLDAAIIQRDQLLPEEATGSVEVRQGASVNLRDTVARGRLSSRYIILDALHELRLSSPDELDERMTVGVGEHVEARMALTLVERGRRLTAPVAGIIADIDQGRIILQVEPEEVVLEAGVDGQVIKVQPGRGVTIESYGGVVQGVWGNGRRAIGTLKMEPEDGLESLFGEEISTPYSGTILITRKPLRDTGLTVMEDLNIGGVIAPSMEADLIPPVLALRRAVMLTEGFGPLRMNNAAMNMLNAFLNRQATLDAIQPGRWQPRRPEIILNPSSRSAGRGRRPNINLVLEVGMEVRLTRPPHAGQMAHVLDLPKTPIVLENGLRLLCAEVETITGEKVMVPLANIELSGQ